MCKHLEGIYDKGWAYPFRMATITNVETNETVRAWVCDFNRLTDTGRPSTKPENRTWEIVSYCPFCGAKLEVKTQ